MIPFLLKDLLRFKKLLGLNGKKLVVKSGIILLGVCCGYETLEMVDTSELPSVEHWRQWQIERWAEFSLG